jgi:NAD(P)-dependent dehydrogenase (short-subunit alcohol dehydrogenase family)
VLKREGGRLTGGLLAGWTKMTNFMDLDDNMEEDVWDRCFTVNVKSHLWLMHAAKKYLEESEGCFVSTASGEYPRSYG